MSSVTRFELYSLPCPTCQTRNSPLSKQCVKCGSLVIEWRREQKPQTNLLHMRLPWSVPLVVLTAVFGWFTFALAKGWMSYAEAQLESSLANDQYLALQRIELRERNHRAQAAQDPPIQNEAVKSKQSESL